MATVGFCLNHLTDELFINILRKMDENAQLKCWSKCGTSIDGGVLSRAATENSNTCLLGFIEFIVKYTIPGYNKIQCKRIVFKSKVRGCKTLAYMKSIHLGFDEKLLKLWDDQLCQHGIHKIEYTELTCVQMSALQPVLPEIYWSWMDEEHDIFVFAMEYFDAERFTHLDTANDISQWKDEDIIQVLSGMAKVHASNYGVIPEHFDNVFDIRSGTYLLNLKSTFLVLMEQVHLKCPELLNDIDYKLLLNVLNKFDKVGRILDESPNTLVHYDATVRNLCLRSSKVVNKETLCLYDWELACLAPPQIDVAHFLTSALPENTAMDQWHYFVNSYLSFFKLELEKSNLEIFKSQLKFDQFLKVFDMCMFDRLLKFHIINMGVSAKQINFGSYLKRVIRTGIKYMQNTAFKYNFCE